MIYLYLYIYISNSQTKPCVNKHAMLHFCNASEDSKRFRAPESSMAEPWDSCSKLWWMRGSPSREECGKLLWDNSMNGDFNGRI